MSFLHRPTLVALGLVLLAAWAWTETRHSQLLLYVQSMRGAH